MTPDPGATPRSPASAEATKQIVELLDSYFRLTLRLDLDEDIPAAAAEIAALLAERENSAVKATAEQLLPALVAAETALLAAPGTCRHHGSDLEQTGIQGDLPRCESCRQLWRVRRALKVINTARGSIS